MNGASEFISRSFAIEDIRPILNDTSIVRHSILVDELTLDAEIRLQTSLDLEQRFLSTRNPAHFACVPVKEFIDGHKDDSLRLVSQKQTACDLYVLSKISCEIANWRHSKASAHTGRLLPQGQAVHQRLAVHQGLVVSTWVKPRRIITLYIVFGW